MANHESAVKRDRQSKKRRAQNRSNAQRLKTQLKKFRSALDAKKKEDVEKLLGPTLSIIDKSIQKGVLHKNAAARHKSRLMRRVHQAMASTAL